MYAYLHKTAIPVAKEIFLGIMLDPTLTLYHILSGEQIARFCSAFINHMFALSWIMVV